MDVPVPPEPSLAWRRPESSCDQTQIGKGGLVCRLRGGSARKGCPCPANGKTNPVLFYPSIRPRDDGRTGFAENQHPLWPGYLFVSCGIDERIRVLQTSDALHIVGNGSSPLMLDDNVVHALRIASQCASLRPHAFLHADNSVCITHGPLQGLQGYVEKDGCDLTFVVNIDLIQRSYSIRVEASDLVSTHSVKNSLRVPLEAHSLSQM
jgi:transcription antitermination factor NusG